MNFVASVKSSNPIGAMERLFGINRWVLNLRTNMLRLEYGRRFDKMKLIEIDAGELNKLLTPAEMRSLVAHWEEAVQHGNAGPTLIPFAARDQIGAKVESTCIVEMIDSDRCLVGLFRRPPAEEKLSKNNRLLTEFLETFIEHSPTCIVVVDHNGSVISLNSSFLRFIGRDRKADLLRAGFHSIAEKFNHGFGLVVREALQTTKPTRGRTEIQISDTHRQTLYWRTFPLSLKDEIHLPRVFSFEVHEGGPRQVAA